MIGTRTMIYTQGTNNSFFSVFPEWLQRTCFPLGKKPKPAVEPMVIIILAAQWEQFDDTWQNVTCKAVSVWWWCSEDAEEGSGQELTHGVGWGVGPCLGNCGAWPMVLMQRWAHGDTLVFMDTSVLLFVLACSQNLVVINILFPLSSAGLHCVQFLLGMVHTVLCGICCPRGFVLKPFRLPWWHRDHVVTVVRRDRHWLYCSEVIYSQ